MISNYPVTLHELSICLVEQLNLIQNFAGFGEVVSIMVPFLCSHCKLEFQVAINAKNLPKKDALILEEVCPKCKAFAQLDEEPKFYFKFSRR